MKLIVFFFVVYSSSLFSNDKIDYEKYRELNGESLEARFFVRNLEIRNIKIDPITRFKLYAPLTEMVIENKGIQAIVLALVEKNYFPTKYPDIHKKVPNSGSGFETINRFLRSLSLKEEDFKAFEVISGYKYKDNLHKGFIPDAITELDHFLLQRLVMTWVYISAKGHGIDTKDSYIIEPMISFIEKGLIGEINQKWDILDASESSSLSELAAFLIKENYLFTNVFENELSQKIAVPYQNLADLSEKEISKLLTNSAMRRIELKTKILASIKNPFIENIKRIDSISDPNELEILYKLDIAHSKSILDSISKALIKKHTRAFSNKLFYSIDPDFSKMKSSLTHFKFREAILVSILDQFLAGEFEDKSKSILVPTLLKIEKTFIDFGDFEVDKQFFRILKTYLLVKKSSYSQALKEISNSYRDEKLQTNMINMLKKIKHIDISEKYQLFALILGNNTTIPVEYIHKDSNKLEKIFIKHILFKTFNKKIERFENNYVSPLDHLKAIDYFFSQKEYILEQHDMLHFLKPSWKKAIDSGRTTPKSKLALFKHFSELFLKFSEADQKFLTGGRFGLYLLEYAFLRLGKPLIVNDKPTFQLSTQEYNLKIQTIELIQKIINSEKSSYNSKEETIILLIQELLLTAASYDKKFTNNFKFIDRLFYFLEQNFAFLPPLMQETLDERMVFQQKNIMELAQVFSPKIFVSFIKLWKVSRNKKNDFFDYFDKNLFLQSIETLAKRRDLSLSAYSFKLYSEIISELKTQRIELETNSLEEIQISKMLQLLRNCKSHLKE